MEKNENKYNLVENTQQLHNIICSKKCNAVEHEQRGFSSNFFTSFSIEDVFDQIDDSILNYINRQSVIF